MSGGRVDHRQWYESIANRAGGYRKTWTSRIEGVSGEIVFREWLLDLLEPDLRILDAGCGSGEFSLEIARYVDRLTGFDFARNMIDLAKKNAEDVNRKNVIFHHASARELPFPPGSFDLIYSRRGPTSVLLQPQLLEAGGWMLGVHSSGGDIISERLLASGLQEITVEEYDAVEILPTVEDLAAFWTRMPGHPDYTVAENIQELQGLARRFRQGNEFVVPHWRMVWKGKRPTSSR